MPAGSARERTHLAFCRDGNSVRIMTVYFGGLSGFGLVKKQIGTFGPHPLLVTRTAARSLGEREARCASRIER